MSNISCYNNIITDTSYKCQYYVTDSPRYTDCIPCSKFRLYTSGRCKNCVFNIPTFFKVFLEQYFHSQVLFRTDYFIMALRAYYVVPNWHVRCNNTNLHVTFKYTNIPFEHSSAPWPIMRLRSFAFCLYHTNTR